MSGLVVRPARESDADTMTAIYVAAARQAWAHICGDAIWGRSAPEMIDSGTVEPAEGRGHGRVTYGPGPDHLCRER